MPIIKEYINPLFFIAVLGSSCAESSNTVPSAEMGMLPTGLSKAMQHVMDSTILSTNRVYTVHYVDVIIMDYDPTLEAKPHSLLKKHKR